MKKIIFCISAFMMFLSANAQQEESVLRHKGFETNRFIDNWEVSAGVGGQYFHRLTPESLDINPGNFGERVSFAFNASVGKWITPVFGGRVQFQGYSAKSFDIEEALENNFDYVYLHTDIMTNLTNWICGYKSDRFYNAVLLTGFGWAISTTDQMEEWNNEFVFSAGLLNKFRLCDAWDLTLELKSNLTKQDFDNTPEEFRYSLLSDATVGAMYRIPTKRDFDKLDRAQYTNKIAALEKDVEAGKQTIADTEDEVAKLKNALAKEKKAREAAQEAERRAKAAIAPSTNQSLSIFFRLGDSEISDKNQENLKFLAEAIKADKGNDAFTITGYADRETGSASFNEQLSKDRAEAVYNRLVELGVDKNRLKVEYKGDTEQPFSGKAYMNRVAIIKR